MRLQLLKQQQILCSGFPLVMSSYHLGGITKQEKAVKIVFKMLTSSKCGSDFSSNASGNFEDYGDDS